MSYNSSKKPCIRPLGPNGLVNSWSSTDINVYEKDYIWTISHYTFQDARKKHLKSSLFTSDFDGSTQCVWFLYLKPNGEAAIDDHISLYLHLEPTSRCKNVFAKIRFSVMNSDQKESNIWESSISEYLIDSDVEGSNHFSWGCGKFLRKTLLFNSKNRLLPNDKLTLFCQIKYSQVSFTNISHELNSVLYQPLVPANRLSEDFGSLLQSSAFADVVIVVNDTEYLVHKTIMVARSPVFYAMLKPNGMLESEKNRIVIEDIGENALKEMLRYIYTGTVHHLDTLTEELLEAADKYDLVELKEMCEITLGNNLSIDSAACTLALAHSHHADGLKSKAMEYIVANSNEVMSTEGWKTVVASNLHLLNDVCLALSRYLADRDR